MAICLFLGWIIYIRRSRRRCRTSPSAAFMPERMVFHSATPEPSNHGIGATRLRDSSSSRDPESEDPPPPFSPGLYSDYIFQKMQEREGHKKPLENDEDNEGTVYGSDSEDTGVAVEDTTPSHSHSEHIGEAI